VPLNLSLIAEREVEKLGMGAPPELLEAIGLQRSARDVAGIKQANREAAAHESVSTQKPA